MEYRFYNYPKAALFAAKKQSEGYFAEILHVHAGHLWGGSTTGYIVQVSEHTIEDTTQLNDSPTQSDTSIVHRIYSITTWVIFVLSITLSVLVVIGVLFVGLIAAIQLFIAQPSATLRYFGYSIITLLLTCAGIVHVYTTYRNPSKTYHKLTKILLALFVLLVGFCMLLFIG